MKVPARTVPDAAAAAAGFSLVEMMVVTAVLSILAGVAVPSLLGSRAVANESAVLATMRSIATAETQARLSGVVDLDHDGIGEGVGLGELCGAEDLRNGAGRLRPPGLSASLGALDANGRAHQKGYLLCLYLPDAGGVGIAASAANASSIDADLAENAWTCLAWPLQRGNTGNATFFVNQTGELLVCRTTSYSGATAVPPAGAALVGVPPDVIVDAPPAVGTTGADGNLWQPAR